LNYNSNIGKTLIKNIMINKNSVDHQFTLLILCQQYLLFA
jgi:hypothetical protein